MNLIFEMLQSGDISQMIQGYMRFTIDEKSLMPAV